MHPFIHLFGLTIPAYGVMLLFAVLTAYLSMVYFSKREGIDRNKLENIFILTFLAAFVGARVFYGIEHHLPLKEFFKVWEGGLDFFGGFIFGVLAVIGGIIFYRLPVWKVLDVAAVSLLLAHSVGRLSCWLAGCCYGKPTTLPIGVIFPPESVAPSGIPLYPTQLMEATGNFIGYLLLFYLYRRKPFDGFIAALYLLWYGMERFLLEFIRGVTPPIPGLGLTWNQLVCLGAVVLGGLILLWGFFLRRRERNGID
ncbi:MAG TPA: prolipoprotein diacylglyceryl transferase [Aquificales bacterium]|nr:prolipoprotein diacylglyceryl transferase [Aquificales bacterium]